MFKANILADSTHNGNRLITFEVEMPRYIWAEMLTHRALSRNAQSTRAIPVYKMIDNLRNDSEVHPLFMENCPGMSPKEFLADDKAYRASKIWANARESAIASAEALCILGVHKQVAGRLLEPFSTIKAIISATDWDNFFRLRLSLMAQEEIRTIAGMMKSAIDKSTSRRVDVTYWHLPLVTLSEREQQPIDTLKKLSVARCARVSYLNHNNEYDIVADIALYNKLVSSRHASPLEHIATPMPGRHGNFNGWQQHRQEINL
jgi:thymidylate synthase ThyX